MEACNETMEASASSSLPGVPLPHPHHHDIFISHSGAQKGFAMDLYAKLSSIGYSVFVDPEIYSLLPDEHLHLLYSAAQICRVAIVVLSHDFLTSRHPMSELCRFTDRCFSQPDGSNSSHGSATPLTILPLFLKLSPEDIRRKDRLRKWRKIWEKWEAQDSHGRLISVKCEYVVTKLLPHLKGIVRLPESLQGEASYIDEVTHLIQRILPRRQRFLTPNEAYVGVERLCTVILDRFREIEEDPRAPSSVSAIDACIMGMYGPPGGGKSTLCRFLCDHVFDEFRGNVMYVELPTMLDPYHKIADYLHLTRKFSEILSMFVSHIASVDLKQMIHVLKNARLTHKLFLVFDNVSPDNYECYKTMVQAIFSSTIVDSGSRVVLVSRSHLILKNLIDEIEECFKYRCAILECPYLTEAEAIEIMRNIYPSVDEVLLNLLRKFSSSFMHIPFFLVQTGHILKQYNHVEEPELLWKMIEEFMKDIAPKLIEMKFNQLPEDLKVLFLDLALFIIPSGYSKLDVAVPILCSMNDITDTISLHLKIVELQRHSFLSVSEDELQIHDSLIVFAQSLTGNSSYVTCDTLDADKKSDADIIGPLTVHLKCLEARTIYIGPCMGSPSKIFFHIEIGAKTKAVILRNHSQHSTCILGFSGDLSSLVYLELENVAQAGILSSANLSNLVRFEWRNRNTKDTHIVTHSSRKRKWMGFSAGLSSLTYLEPENVARTGMLSYADFPNLVRLEWRNWNTKDTDIVTHSSRKRKSISSFSGQRRKENEQLMKSPWKLRFSLRRDVTSKLRRLVSVPFSSMYSKPNIPSLFHDNYQLSTKSSQVQALDFVPSKLHALDLASQLSFLKVLDLCGTKIENLDFRVPYLGILSSLTSLVLQNCNDLVHLSMEPDCLPKLLALEVHHCRKLQVVEGIGELLVKELQRLKLRQLPQFECDLKFDNPREVSSQLRHFDADGCRGLKININILAATEKLEYISLHGTCLALARKYDVLNAIMSMGKNSQNIQEVSLCDVFLQYMDGNVIHHGLLKFHVDEFKFLKRLSLDGLKHLEKIEEIEHLHKLEFLLLSNLLDLTCVSGTWPRSIESLVLYNCPILEEIPSLENMRIFYLECDRCYKLEVEMGLTRKTMQIQPSALSVAPHEREIFFFRCSREHVAPYEHDIFLFCSPQQKGFATDLHTRLSLLSYSVSFNGDDRMRQPFIPLILSATNSSKVAIIILSHEFVTSQERMIELCAIDQLLSSDVSAPPLTVLPLFYTLLPKDIDVQENVDKWRVIWKGFEEKDGQVCFSADKCETVMKRLSCEKHGIVRCSQAVQGEASYIEEVINRILKIIPLQERFSTFKEYYSGSDRLCNFIFEEFWKLEGLHPSASEANACILGLYGEPGSGKSTLCNIVCESLFHEFRGKVIYLEFKTHASLIQQYAKLLSKLTPYKNIVSMDLDKVRNLLTKASMNHKFFLVFDNISEINYEDCEKMVLDVLRMSILGSSIRVMVVSQSRIVLEKLIKAEECSGYRNAIIEMPCLTESEAMEIMWQHYLSDGTCFLMRANLMTRLLQNSSFQSSSFMYTPFVFQQIGVSLMKYNYNDMEELSLRMGNLLKMVDEGRTDAVLELITMNFKLLPDKVRSLFFDIALFVIPAGYSKSDDAAMILSCMHPISKTDVRKMITDLQKHHFLSVIGDRLQVHDIFQSYVQNIPENTSSYVNKYSQNIPHEPIIISARDSKEGRTININACIHEDQEACLSVEVGAKTCALLVRNHSNYSKCVLGLSGDLSSLVCLEIENMWAMPQRFADLSNLLWFKLRNKNTEDIQMKSSQGSVPLFPWEHPIVTYDRHESGMATSGLITKLQVLILENSSIRRLQDIGQHCPELQVLKVLDETHELMSVGIGNAPKLKRLVIGPSDYLDLLDISDFLDPHFCHCDSENFKPRKTSKLLLQLSECPALQKVCVDVSLFDQVEVIGMLPSKLRHFAMVNVRSSEFIITKLISSNSQLSMLETLHLYCRKVETLSFIPRCFGCLPSLRWVDIQCCGSLMNLSIEKDCLPNLLYLRVQHCYELNMFQGLENLLLNQLLRVKLNKLPRLQCDVICEASSQLECLVVTDCPGVKISGDCPGVNIQD